MTDQQVARIVVNTRTIGEDEVGIAADYACHIKALADERERLKTALYLLSQVRHVSGSAQSTFRWNLKVIDAVLLGADLRQPGVVEAIARGTWKP